MYLGRVVEEGPVRDVIRNPQHPYTRGLIAALPRLDDLEAPLTPVPGDIPSPLERPDGCVFSTRCAECDRVKGDLCRTKRPEYHWPGAQHRVACHHFDPEARA